MAMICLLRARKTPSVFELSPAKSARAFLTILIPSPFFAEIDISGLF
jgi:hypothetical protein